MRIRAAFLAVSAAAMLLTSAGPSFAQRGQGRAQSGVIKSADATGKSFVVTIKRMGTDTDFTVKTDAQTRIAKGHETGAFTDVKPGGFAIFLGPTMQGSTEVVAREVILLDKPHAVAQGPIKSADATAKSFIVTMGRGGQMREVTIKTSDKTHYTSGREAGKWEDVAAGKTAIIIGEGNPREGMTAVFVRILPMRPANP